MPKKQLIDSKFSKPPQPPKFLSNHLQHIISRIQAQYKLIFYNFASMNAQGQHSDIFAINRTNLPFQSESNQQASDNNKEKIKTAEEFQEFIDSTYKCNYESYRLIMGQVSIKEILNFITKDDLYLMRAAEKLSYPSLAFLIDFGRTPFLRSKFTQSSQILKTFIQNLITFEIDKKQKIKILKALLIFNEEEVEEAVIESKNSELIKLMFATKKSKYRDSDDEYDDAYDDEYDPDDNDDSDDDHPVYQSIFNC